MKKASLIYLPAYEATPLSFWAHRHLDAGAWVNANQFDPLLPHPVPGQGWAQLAKLSKRSLLGKLVPLDAAFTRGPVCRAADQGIALGE